MKQNHLYQPNQPTPWKSRRFIVTPPHPKHSTKCVHKHDAQNSPKMLWNTNFLGKLWRGGVCWLSRGAWADSPGYIFIVEREAGRKGRREAKLRWRDKTKVGWGDHKKTDWSIYRSSNRSLDEWEKKVKGVLLVPNVEAGVSMLGMAIHNGWFAVSKQSSGWWPSAPSIRRFLRGSSSQG